jgi:hypothetical protein
MAIQRLSLADITTAILEIMMYSASTNAPWGSNVTLYKRINEYMQRLPMRINTVARELAVQGLIKTDALPIHMDMWHTDATSATTGTGLRIAASASTVYLPIDFDYPIAFYDITGKRSIHIIEDPDKWLDDEIVQAPPGVPKRIHIQGYCLDGTDWRRQAVLYPSTVSGVTPSIRLSYYRLPAIMPGTTASAEYPDIDPKYESIVIYGPICDLARNTGFEYDRYSKLEREMLVEMCLTAGTR